MSTNDDHLNVELAEHLGALKAIYEKIRYVLPSVKIQVPTASTSALQVLVGKWDGSQFTTTLLQEVAPGSTFSIKLKPVAEFSDEKVGDQLLLRPSDGVALYGLTNLESYFGYVLTVTPPVYPWWGTNATVVRWGPSAPYMVQPSQTIYSYVTTDLQDVFYYFAIG